MNRRVGLVALTLLVVAISGCFPLWTGKSLVWSPDGRRAVLCTRQAAFLMDGTGKMLTEPFAPGAYRAEWLPDGTRLLVLCENAAKQWQPVEACLPQDERQRYADLAGRVLKELGPLKGRWQAIEQELMRDISSAAGYKDFNAEALETHNLPTLARLVREGNETDFGVVWLCLRDQHGAAVKEILGGGGRFLDELSVRAWAVDLFDVAGEKPERVRTVVAGLEAIVELRVAPTGRAFAYTAGVAEEVMDRSGQPLLTLYAAAIDGAAPTRRVAEHVSCYPDWSADGTYLVFAHRASGDPGGTDELRLGSIARRRVCNDDGSLLDAPKGAEVEEIVGVVFAPSTKVRCLKDGRILFASVELHLPTTAADMPGALNLFAVHPGQQPGVARLVLRREEHKLLTLLDLFEVSPDEKQLVICDIEGFVPLVSVLDLASGRVEPVHHDPGQGANKPETILLPVWRNAKELCFLVAAGSPLGAPGRAEVVLYTVGEKRSVCISRDWPDRYMAEFLGERERADPAPVPPDAAP